MLTPMTSSLDFSQLILSASTGCQACHREPSWCHRLISPNVLLGGRCALPRSARRLTALEGCLRACRSSCRTMRSSKRRSPWTRSGYFGVSDLPVDLAEATHLGRAVRVNDGRLLRERQVSQRRHTGCCTGTGYGHADDEKSPGRWSVFRNTLGPSKPFFLGLFLSLGEGRGGLRRWAGMHPECDGRREGGVPARTRSGCPVRRCRSRCSVRC